MATGTVTSADSVNYVDTTSSSTKQSTGLTVDSETFLKLLVAQMQYQDPLEPQSNTDFVTQLAQMTSLEQMQQMNASLSGAQAYDMIGKYAYAEILNSTTGVTDQYLGYVSSIIYKDSQYYAVIQDNAVPVSDILQVFDTAAVEAAASESSTSDSSSDSETDTTSST